MSNVAMSNVAMRSSGRPLASPALKFVDPYLAITLAGCLYALVVSPLLLTSCEFTDNACLMAPRPENRIVWPVLAALSLVAVLRNRSRLVIPPHIICLLVYLGFAGLSVVWAFRPEISAVRYSQQVMVVTAVVMPALIMTGKTDLLRGLFVCFAMASVLNLFYVFGPQPKLDVHAAVGSAGYFTGKNYLGQCATITLLLSLYEMRRRGFWRIISVFTACIAIYLVVLSNSKTAVALAILSPLLASIAIFARRITGRSLATLLLVLLGGYLTFSFITGFSIYRISYMLYGEPTFTGRKWIWEFALSEIAYRPLHGWGYQSFWLVGPDAPSVTHAPGFIKTMPNAHNGYVDATLEMGYIGLILLLTFLFATLHACGRLIDRDRVRAWSVLSLFIFVIIGNCLESTLMRGFEFMWVLLLILAVEIARHWQPVCTAALVPGPVPGPTPGTQPAATPGTVPRPQRRRPGTSALPRPQTRAADYARRGPLRLTPPKA